MYSPILPPLQLLLSRSNWMYQADIRNGLGTLP